MTKTIKIIFIFLLILMVFSINICYGLDLNLTDNSAATTTNDANTSSNTSATNATNDTNTNSSANTSSNTSTDTNTSTTVGSLNSLPETDLGLSNILNILLHIEHIK